jgi:hypothetical protein
MNLLSKLLVSGCLCASLGAHAGVHQTTVHSRANCLNNESITWWLNHPYNWRVVSYHISAFNEYHSMDTGFQHTWRAHAIHWGEGDITNLWTVYGDHFQYEYSKTVPFDQTEANFCDIIHGWY